MEGNETDPLAYSGAGEKDLLRLAAMAKQCGLWLARKEDVDETRSEEAGMAAMESLLEEMNAGKVPPDRNEAWIAVHAMHDAKDYLRHEKCLARHEVQWSSVSKTARVEISAPPLISQSPEVELLHKEAATRIRAVLDQLTPRDRNFVHGKYLHDESIKDIADDLGVSVDAVKQGLRRARRSLNEQMLIADLTEAELRDYDVPLAGSPLLLGDLTDEREEEPY